MVACKACNPLREPDPAAAKRWALCGVFLGVVSIGFIITGVLVAQYLNKEVDDGVLEATMLDREDRLNFDAWLDNKDDPIWLSVYMMDIVNPHEILEGAVPVVVERGPYVYEDRRVQVDVEWNDNHEIISSREYQFFVWNKEKSVEDPSERVVTQLNLPFAGVRAGLEFAEIGGTDGKNFLLLIYQVVPETKTDEYHTLFQERSVTEILFGFDDPVLAWVSSIDPTVSPRYPGLIFNYTSPNHTREARHKTEVWTGKNKNHGIREVYRFENMTYMQACKHPTCPPNLRNPGPGWGSMESSLIQGSLGSQFPYPVTKDQKLAMFYASHFRTFDMEFVLETEYKGIPVYRYKIPDSSAFSAKTLPENADYYQFGVDGLYNVTMFAADVPMFLSKPHFIDVAPPVGDGVYGVWPDSGVEHESYFEVEPDSGLSMHFVTSSQVNLVIKPMPDMPTIEGGNTTTWFPNIRESVVPLFWAKEEAGIGDKDADDFVVAVYGTKDLALGIEIAFVVLGCVGILLGSLVLFKGLRASRRKTITDFADNERTALFASSGANGNGGEASEAVAGGSPEVDISYHATARRGSERETAPAAGV